ncbi:polysaccharide deacetylase family protein [Bacillus sp. 3103sda1]|uniref:polysaccharide deacetylase family protein n=1 Tax=Bacillus sp. 3103sda1 TaxID=2953808 RepID=UPI00209E37FE|nr:polysaccharide deacetylase family protein [Bacillus sp. 3103sda1]MCP1123584.1 polysaccharide deacetylase family protein [Bacillus sp. 3103sda1]
MYMSLESQFADFYNRIIEMKKKFDSEPMDANFVSGEMIIPAYNGLKINVERSLNNMIKDRKWDESLLVYEEVTPKVLISSLPPAPIFFGNPNKPMASIMVNVAWRNENIPTLLDIMEEAQCKSTFFLQGGWTHKFSELARKIKNAGHEIGSHAYSHPDMRGQTLEYIEWELKKTNQVIYKELGVRPKLFTPPSGEFDERVIRTAIKEGMYTVLSSIDTQDWKMPPPEEMVHQVKTNVKRGFLILIHPTESSVQALPEMLKAIKDKGLKIVTVSNLLSPHREVIDRYPEV